MNVFSAGAVDLPHRRLQPSRPLPVDLAELGTAIAVQNEKDFEQDVDDDVRRRITVHYVRRVDDLLELVLRPAEAAGDRPLESPSPRL